MEHYTIVVGPRERDILEISLEENLEQIDHFMKNGGMVSEADAADEINATTELLEKVKTLISNQDTV